MPLEVWESSGFRLPETAGARTLLKELRNLVAGSLRHYQVAGKDLTLIRISTTIYPDGPQWIVPEFTYKSKESPSQEVVEKFHAQLRREPVLSQSLSLPDVCYTFEPAKAGQEHTQMLVNWRTGKVKSQNPPRPYAKCL